MELGKYLKTGIIGSNKRMFTTIDSTNVYAKKWGSEGAEHGSLVLADEQTGGKGRLGRSWHSPRGTGVWMSIILKPNLPIDCIPRLTLLAALSMAEVIEEVTGLEVGIKWPNDLVVNHKKVCGILAEGRLNGDKMAYIVLGLGVNVNMKTFPGELEYATSLAIEGQKEYDRTQIVGLFIQKFEAYYNQFIEQKGLGELLECYKKYCITLKKVVKLIEGSNSKEVYVKNILEDGSLEVENDLGQIQKVQSGEVSVRGLYGYS